MFQFIGYRQSNHDYSNVIYPAAITECESCHTGGTPTENFPLVATPNPVPVCDMSGFGSTTLSWGDDLGLFDIRVNAPDGKLYGTSKGSGSSQTSKWIKDGTVFFMIDKATGETIQELPVNATVLGCVGDTAPGSSRGEPGVQHTNWMDNLSRKSCGSCHDSIDFAAGEGHIVQTTDGSCHFCHKANTGVEFDNSVVGAHTTLYKSAQLPGVLVKFIEVTDTDPGDNPTVTFSVGGKNGKYNPADMNRLRLALNGPNDDFSFYVIETVGDKAVAKGSNWSYTFEAALPEDAMGSYTVSMEGRVDADVDYGDEVEGERDYAQNPMMAFAVTDAMPVPRRMVVSEEKCESCHVSLSLHGGNRTEVQYCLSCHRPDLVDIAEPLQESVNMKWMIHKIHRGAELENGYVVIRSRGTYDFSNIEFTGDLRNCEACHVNGSEQLPLPTGLLPQLTPNFWWDEIEPAAAACLSCHDGDSAAAHAYANTTIFGESCATCHGEGKSESVDKVHAR